MLKTLLLAQASVLALAAALPAWAQDAAEAPAPETAAPETTPGAAAPEAASPEDAGAATDEAGAAEAAAPSAPSAPASPDTVVATVNGTAITLGEVALAARALPPQYQQLPPDVLFAGVTEQIVQQELLAQTLTDVPPRVDLALANERRSLLAGEAIRELSEGAVTEEAVQAAYDATYAGAEPGTEWNASHILVATEEEARAVLARLEAGEDFATVAGEVSTDTGSGAQGGELGFFGPGQMVPEFEAGVAALQPGEVSEPIQSQFGFHVIRLNETREQQPPALEDVRPEIEAQVRDEAIQARLGELQAQGEVTTPSPGQFDPAVLADPALLGD